ncbi:MAG: response regulator transcription factor [Terracidiphilus sp.]
MRTLIIEDEPRMLELLSEGLYEHGFTVMTASDGESGLKTALSHELDSIVLDIGLPRMDGLALMRELRAQGRVTPVLMLTARDAEDDIIRGLDLGADDYLTKPFSFAELVARLQSITRPRREESEGTIAVEDLVIYLNRHSVARNMKSIDLSRLEFLLLVCLARRAGQCMPREALIEFVWGPNHAVGASALDVLVNSLRAKIDAPFRESLIGTVRGTGYTFRRVSIAQERKAR